LIRTVADKPATAAGGTTVCECRRAARRAVETAFLSASDLRAAALQVVDHAAVETGHVLNLVP
jgi:hypothetical protein